MRRLGAELGPALRFVALHRDLMRAFAEASRTITSKKTSLPSGRGV
jgi:hypothetical protein